MRQKGERRKKLLIKKEDPHEKHRLCSEPNFPQNDKTQKPLKFQRFFLCKKTTENRSMLETLARILLFNGGKENTKSIIGGELDDIQYPKMFHSRW